ncbi:TPA: WxL domain-containing protein [Enterococcus faecalis]|uniref:WxL domain-containing protein n=1 Tax=Enterococcus faecalis TaxID=1351 RepID=UPI0007C2310B|nr:WxL domain-containing protein [Enterococcus faecalis]HAY6579323.1 WxL domain-containing protein [Staphylococcus aureus]ELZ4685992.1 WxL domain-containing protein [Enterococcus faecalis]MBJ0378294.1 WxL domain-containing protein [Enterococcus faecalis]MBJ1783542.1 WxL domain-containing protein [Enterococcus faecalis]MDF4227598.1 WxL domain-containing protein [Enterococcus faecalis]
MKRNKWQRLAAIGLCSSLLVNAFSGMTAVAETVTIESSPTAESSAKAETPASSVKEETTKASTQNSQVTTDTSQEEEKKEIEKQAETELKEDQKEEPQAETPANSSENDLQKGISPRWVPNNQSIYPRMTFGFTDETGKVFADETLTLSGTYYKLARHIETRQWRAYADRYPIVSSNAGGGQYRVAVNAAVPLPYDFFKNLPVGYDLNIYAIEQLKIDNTLKYVDNIAASTGTIRATSYINQQVSETPQFGNQGNWGLNERDNRFSKNSANIFSLSSVTNTTNNEAILRLLQVASASNGTNPIVILVGFDGTPTYQQTVNYVVTRKQVTEKFVDANGVAITPPTGFTQNKKTPMTSNAFTFKQAGTLPDTYKVGTKTYKFKGWYKGKTKPATLQTTKAPSYAVTYDGNDDLNVVYEGIVTFDFPESTYQFGFVDVATGNLIDPSLVNMNYTLWQQEEDVQTNLMTNQKGVNSGKFKSFTIPEKKYELRATSTWYGPYNMTFTIPKRYKKMDITKDDGTTDSLYPVPTVTNRLDQPVTITPTKYNKMKQVSGQTFDFNEVRFGGVPFVYSKVLFGSNNTTVGDRIQYYKQTGPVYYYLTNRKVTEAFVDSDGTKITPPTGFTQGKQTVITNDAYTFKQSGTLPDSYTVDGKTYKFKGWYKGETKPATLQTTKAPSYTVTYDDNDDLNVVYEELIPKDTWVYPGFHADFVDEKGQAFNEPLTFSGNYTQTLRKAVDQTYVTTGAMNPLVSIKNTNKANVYTITTQSRVNVPANFDEVPSDIYDMRAYAINDWNITTELKYVDKIETMNTTLPVSVYPVGFVGTDPVFNNSGPGQLNEIDKSFKKGIDNKFSIKATFGVGSSVNTVPRLLLVARATGNPENKIVLHGFDGTQDFKQTMNYKVTRKQVTENFVDANGAKITAPTGFTQGNQVPMNSNTFKYTAAQALPTTYTAGGKTYTFQGWYKGKTKPSTLNKTTTPTFNTTFDGNDDMTAMYKEEIPTASVTLTRPKEVIDTNTNVIWTTTITNTSKAPLQNLTLKKGPNWSAGLTIPTFMEVTPEGETTKSIPVNSTLWTNGVSLPNAVPIGKKVSIAFTTRATGKPNTVLKAEVVVFGGIKDSTVDNFVRIRPNDQEVVTPTTEGFISVPTFDFGQVGVAGSKQQHNLKKAADYYGNGTRNPYVRIKKTQPNWSLTAQLSQPKSATDSLPTATRLLLGAAPVSSFTNYNQPTELKNAVGTTSAISLTANNTATSIIANKQFTGSNVYQLDFTFNNVKLEVPANQGVKGQQYKAAVTWNLVTGP